VLGGALVPYIAQALANEAGSLKPVGYSLSAAALVSLIALWLLKRQPITD